jgi:transposase
MNVAVPGAKWLLPCAGPIDQMVVPPTGRPSPLGRITRRGDSYLRTLLIQGAKSAVLTAHKRQDPISRWALRLRERSGWQVAAVALANKNARILWAVMTKGERFDARHVSVRPGAPVPATA